MDRANGSRSVAAWVLSDERAGHLTQLEGLLAALSDHIEMEVYRVPLHSSRISLLADLWHCRFAPGSALPSPRLLLAAGHATHLPLIAATRANGGFSVVLMKPSLPLSLFDLVVAPHHDRIAPASNLVETRGVLNRVRWSDAHDPGVGAILIGGPSKSHGWEDAALIRRLASVVSRSDARHWLLTTSPRTPGSFLTRLHAEKIDRLDIIPFADTPSGWLPETLAQASEVWVTEDSVSMVYEALSSGAAVGILPVPRLKHGRVVSGLDGLIGEGLVVPFGKWQSGAQMRKPETVFNEADRVAREVVKRSGL